MILVLDEHANAVPHLGIEARVVTQGRGLEIRGETGRGGLDVGETDGRLVHLIKIPIC
jgi:hypothetical protein